MYYITKAKSEFIKTALYECSVKGTKPNLSDFDKLSSAPELHYLADLYNWDDGVEVLNWIIESPFCDLGTAKLIFWEADPIYYTRYATLEEAGLDLDTLALLFKIIHYYNSGKFKKAIIKYNPASNNPNFKQTAAGAKWIIPDGLKRATGFRGVLSIDYINILIFNVKGYFKELKRERHRSKRRKK